MTDVADLGSITLPSLVPTTPEHGALDLQRLEEGALVDAVVPDGVAEPFGLYAFASTDVGAELGRNLERAVFLETFGDTPELLAAEYAPYEASSLFFVVVDHRRRVAAGVMRVILPSAVGAKSLNDLGREWGDDPAVVLARTTGAPPESAIWDVATLAVAPEYRGRATAGLVSLSLYQALFMTGERWGNRGLVAILDTAVLRMLQWQLAGLFASFPGIDSRPYLGSASSRPVWCDIATWRARLREVKPVLHDLFFEGIGHEEAMASPSWDAAAATARAISSPDVEGRYWAVDDSDAEILRSTLGSSLSGTGLQ